jgi:diacylglycerol kinase
MAYVSPSSQLTPAETSPRRPPDWRDKLRVALRGIKYGIRGQSSFFVHFFFAALVVAAGVVLGCNTVEWCILLACIGMVLAAELFNSAIETLFRALDADAREKACPALDIAAGGVLLASITASLIGGLVFAHRVWHLIVISH